MSGSSDASKLLRPGLLEGVSVVIAATPSAGAERSDSLGRAVRAVCAGLGARVSAWEPGEPPDADTDLLVLDCASLFAGGGVQGEPAGPREALSACLDGAWEATRSVASAAFIEPTRAGRIVYLAPAPDAGRSGGAQYADAARAGLENLARTLSIEWARHKVTAVTVAPAADTPDDEVAALVAYLGSPAGEYFSGALLDLRGPAGAPLDR